MNGNEAIDEAERRLSGLPRVHAHTEHALALGFYIRQVTLPADAIFTTKTHGREHPFHISKGRCILKTTDGEEQVIVAPFTGVTKSETRRIIYVQEETVWTTFHPLEEGDMMSMTDAAEAALMIPRKNPEVAYANSLNQQLDKPDISGIIPAA